MALAFSAAFRSSSIAVIAPRCAVPRKLELTSVAVRHDPLPLLLLGWGLQKNICAFFYSIIGLPLLIACDVCFFFNHVWGFQAEEESADMFYTCGPNEAMVVSGKVAAAVYIETGQSTQMYTESNISWSLSYSADFGQTCSHLLQDYVVLLHWWLQEAECLSSRASSRFRGWYLNK